MGLTCNQSKHLHDNSAMVCSLMVLNELSNRIGVKHRWQAKLTLTLGLDISNYSDSTDFKTSFVVTTVVYGIETYPRMKNGVPYNF